MKKYRIFCWVVILALLVLGATGCKEDAPQVSEPPPDEGSQLVSEPEPSSLPEPEESSQVEDEVSEVSQEESSQPQVSQVPSPVHSVPDDPPSPPESSTVEESEPGEEPEESSEPEPVGPTLTMEAQQSDYPVTTEEIRLIITNETEAETAYDFYYEIQRLSNGRWEPVPLEFDTEDIAAILFAGQSGYLTVRLYQDQYDYTPGLYRVIKTEGGEVLTANFVLYSN